jgi:hypothetical protein
VPLINADGCPIKVEVAGPERTPAPPVIISRDDGAHAAPASGTIACRSPSSCRDGSARLLIASRQVGGREREHVAT